MDVTAAADNMFDSVECTTNVLHSIGFMVCLAAVQADFCCWILLGESSLAVVHLHACLWGFPRVRLGFRLLAV